MLYLGILLRFMTLNQKNIKKIDILVLSLLPLFAACVSLLFTMNFLTSALLFSGLLAAYLSYRAPRAIARCLIFAAPFGIIGGLFFDHLAILDNSWHVPSIFAFRIFHTVPIEDLVWAFLLVYSTVIFYTHFFNASTHKIIGTRMKYYACFVLVSFIIFLFLIQTNSRILTIENFYLKGGFVLIFFPVVIFLIFFPQRIFSFAKTGLYFFYAGMLQELTALKLGHWSFSRENYWGWITIFGLRFPYEELIFWLIFFSAFVLAYFEFFDDDRIWRKK